MNDFDNSFFFGNLTGLGGLNLDLSAATGAAIQNELNPLGSIGQQGLLGNISQPNTLPGLEGSILTNGDTSLLNTISPISGDSATPTIDSFTQAASDTVKSIEPAVTSTQSTNPTVDMSGSDTTDWQKQGGLGGTKLADLFSENGLKNVFNNISLKDLAGLYSMYKSIQSNDLRDKALKQNMAIAKANQKNNIKTLNNAKERSRVIGAALAGKRYKPKYDTTDYKTGV
jgi:hypothetical protein